jgi:hypothetical protein
MHRAPVPRHQTPDTNTSLPAPWVDRIFAKLAVRYGEAFMRQYGGLDIAAVKADWAEELDGFDGEAIGYGLRFLPSERPPNVLQFRDQCRRAPARSSSRWGYDHTPADPAVAAQVRQASSRTSVAAQRGPPERGPFALQERHQRGERLSQFAGRRLHADAGARR